MKVPIWQQMLVTTNACSATALCALVLVLLEAEPGFVPVSLLALLECAWPCALGGSLEWDLPAAPPPSVPSSPSSSPPSSSGDKSSLSSWHQGSWTQWQATLPVKMLRFPYSSVTWTSVKTGRSFMKPRASTDGMGGCGFTITLVRRMAAMRERATPRPEQCQCFRPLGNSHQWQFGCHCSRSSCSSGARQLILASLSHAREAGEHAESAAHVFLTSCMNSCKTAPHQRANLHIKRCKQLAACAT